MAVILWAAAALVSERAQVVFDLVWSAAGPRSRRAMRIAGNLLIGGLSAAVLLAGMLLFATKALTGIRIGAMVKEGWMFIVMLLALLLAMTVFPQIVLWLPQTMGFGVPK